MGKAIIITLFATLALIACAPNPTPTSDLEQVFVLKGTIPDERCSKPVKVYAAAMEGRMVFVAVSCFGVSVSSN